METVKIEVIKRTEFGKEKVKQLRAKNLIPAEVYGTDLKENLSILLDYKLVSNTLLKGPRGRNTLFSFDVDGKTINTICYEIQVHPITKQILHIDLKTVNEKTKIRVKVALKPTGSSTGVQKGGMLQQKVDYIPLFILPQEIPVHIDADVTNLDIKEQLQIKDLILPPSAEIIKLSPKQPTFTVKG